MTDHTITLTNEELHATVGSLIYAACVLSDPSRLTPDNKEILRELIVKSRVLVKRCGLTPDYIKNLGLRLAKEAFEHG